MAALFHQSIAQFAPLRTFARIHTTTPYSQLIRELFPKALFDEQHTTYKLFIEIAWSFLSKATSATNAKYKRKWYNDRVLKHRIGGLPATIYVFGMQKWCENGEYHRNDNDPKTGLTLPAVIHMDGSQRWYRNGNLHRDDKDPRTGLTLPAIIYADGPQRWYRNGKHHRDDKDPRTGLTLPAIIYADGSQYWMRNGKIYRDDKDPQTGLILPAIIRAKI